MTLPFTLNQLEVFLLVLDTGSFSAAADQLNVSQPAVSAQVRELERKLGLRLVERVGRTIAPTAAGVALSSHARALLEAGRLAAEAVADHVEGVHGTVRIGTGATACLHLLPPILQTLRQAYPRLHVMVKTGNTDDIVRRVELNALDLGLVALPFSSRALVVSGVLRDSFVAVTGASEPRLPKAVRASDLKDVPLVMFEPGTNTRELVDAWLLAGGIRVRPAMELGSIEAIKEMALAGLGASVLPAMALRKADDESLQIRPLKPALSRELGIVMRQDKPLTRGMLALVKAVLAARTTLGK